MSGRHKTYNGMLIGTANRGVLIFSLGMACLIVRAAHGQTQQIPQGLVTSQAAAVLIGQQDFSSITPGTTAERWRTISGFAVAGNRLIVADSSYLVLPPDNNNRILIYNDLNSLRSRLPQDTLPAADVVIGQPDFVTSDPGTSATRMFQPVAVATDGTRLFVAEWGNNRILIFNRIPETNSAAADVVVGQSGFTTSTFGAGPSALRSPNGVWTDGTRLYIADTLNNRILIYNSIPTQNGAAANVVLGQPNFNDFRRLPTAANTLFDPMSVTTDGQRMIVTDFGNNRVLIYNSIPTQSGAPADVVVGQPDFTSNAPGNTQTSLNFPRYAYSDGTRLLIVDSGNNRILIYDQIPTQNGAAADIVLGQADFLGLLESCAAGNFAVPYAAAGHNGMLLVSDAFNRRILGLRAGPRMVDAVVNAASFSTTPQTAACNVVLLQPPVAPGGIASIFGTSLADTTEQASALPLKKEMGGIKVRFNGIEAPLFSVSPTQVNVQVPFELKGYSASLEIEKQTAAGAVVSAAVPVGLANGAPGIFTRDGNPSGAGMITHGDFSPVTEANPARKGETLVLFATGLGTVDHPVTNGVAAEFAAQGALTIGGVVGAGQTVTVTVNDVLYSYTAGSGDTLDTVVNRLAETIEANDPIVSATANTADFRILLRARVFGDQGINNTFSASVSDGSTLSAEVEGGKTVPGAITFRGTPEPGQAILVSLLNSPFLYITDSSDTAETIVRNLAAMISGDPNVFAEADGLTLRLGLKDPGAGLVITYSILVSEAGATITAIPVSEFRNVPGSVRIGGTAGAGQVVTVFLSTTPYSYTTVAGDTLETVVTRLAALINDDPNVSATADVPNLSIQLALKMPNLNIPFSAVVRRAGALRASTGTNAVVPTTVTLSGTPRPGEAVRVTLAGTIYSYTAAAGDTAATIASKLAQVINADPNVSATADLENAGIVLALKSGSEEAAIPVSAVVSPPASSLTAISAFQFFAAGVANVENDVSAMLGEEMALVPGQIVLAGTADPGQTITVSLLETQFSYTTAPGDTLQSVLTNLAALISSDPNVTATADVTNSLINLQLRDPAGGAEITFSVSFSPGATLSAFTVSAERSEALAAGVSFAGLVKGTVGLYQVNFQVPESAPAKPDTKLTLSQNLIIFGSVSNFDILSNTVTFPVADPPAE